MTTRYDFDQIVTREGTASLKFDGRGEVFGRADVIPLWVADMDFAVPEAVRRALSERAAHPVYGYTRASESVYASLLQWLQQRHDWVVVRDSVMLCPGVVPSLHAAILALTQVGEGVIVQPPVYAPFLSAPKITGRRLLLNPLKLVAGRYTFDLDDLVCCAEQGGRMLILCSPHNPVGRVWHEVELQGLLDVCKRHDIIVVSDEIHADLIFPGNTHVPLAKLAGNSLNIITAVAPSKTFNIPGLGLSALVVPDAAQRAAISRAFETLHVSVTNPFSLVAFEAAYLDGADWLDALLVYLAGTREMVREYLAEHLPQIRLTASEGTYLLWLNCGALGMNDAELKRFLVQEAGVGMSPGVLFGEQGRGYMRMNIGAPRSVITQALRNISAALAARDQR